MPRLEISITQIRHNTRMLSKLFGQKGISLMGVSKAVLGEPSIVKAMIEGGVKFIADSRIENIQKMKKAKINTQYVLLCTSPSKAESVVVNSDISLNTEIKTLKKLSYYAKVNNKYHKVIVMVELGDLREGVLPCNLSQFIKEAISFSHIKIVGIGCNLACYGGIKPDVKNMQELSNLKTFIEDKFQFTLNIVSGGNSANYEWYKSANDIGNINNLRLGEAILLGRESLNRRPIPGLYTGAFQLIAEVIEVKKKASLPYGEVSHDAFGSIPHFEDRGIRRRAILALGRQDVLISNLILDYNKHMEILGASSDHIILDSKKDRLYVGDEVTFNLGYGALLAAMTSPFIRKEFIST